MTSADEQSPPSYENNAQSQLASDELAPESHTLLWRDNVERHWPRQSLSSFALQPGEGGVENGVSVEMGEWRERERWYMENGVCRIER